MTDYLWAFTFGAIIGMMSGLGTAIYFYTKEQYMEYSWRPLKNGGERLYAGKSPVGEYSRLIYFNEAGSFEFKFGLPGFTPIYDNDVDDLKERAVRRSDEFFNSAFERIQDEKRRHRR